MGQLFSPPPTPAATKPPPVAPDESDQAIKNAKLMERRRQLGLVGSGSTWLTGARGDTTPAVVGTTTLLGK